MMDSFLLPLLPAAFYFAWVISQQHSGTTCPHCGGALGGFAGLAAKPKVADDELARGVDGAGFRPATTWPLVALVALIGAILAFIVLLVRSTPITPQQAAPPVPPVVRPVG